MVRANDLTPIYADWYGLLLLKERFGVASEDILYMPRYYLPEGSYVYLRSRNDYDWTIVDWSGVGQREYRGYVELELYDLDLVYRSGISGVWQV